MNTPDDKQRTQAETHDPLADRGIGRGKPGPGRGHKTGGNTLRLGHGSAASIIARLKRDAPEYAERYAKGEFRSARAAARAADIKVDTPWPVVAERAWKHMTEGERAAFLAEHAAKQSAR